MDILTLICFVKIAEGETFQSVADVHHLSQSNLSKRIQRLEDELNTQLFIRAHRTVSLTEAGQCLYAGLSKIAPMFYDTLNRVTSFANHSTINCCVVPAPTVFDLNEHFRQFSSSHTDIYLNISREENASRAIAQLNTRYDCTIMHYPETQLNSIQYTWLYDDSLLLVMSKNHPLAQQKTVSLSQLSQLKTDHILCRPHLYDAIFTSLGMQTFDISSLSIVNSQSFRRSRILSQIAYGHGIALFFQSDIAAFNLSNIATCQIEEIPSVPLAFLQRTDSSVYTKTQIFRKYIIGALSRN